MLFVQLLFFISHCFLHHIVNVWNPLPDSVVAVTPSKFKKVHQNLHLLKINCYRLRTFGHLLMVQSLPSLSTLV